MAMLASFNLAKQFRHLSLLGTQCRMFALYRKPKSCLITEYACIPDWVKPAPIDPFDYKLRPKEEVKEEFKYFPADFSVQAEYKKYVAGDYSTGTLDNRERVAKIYVDLRTMSLSPQQRERFIYLLGPRYKGGHKVKIVMKRYNTFQENYFKSLETLREIFWEAKRAPAENATLIRNPYRREQILKKMFGKTREERKAKRLEVKNWIEETKRAVDEEEIGYKKQEGERQESLRERRRKNAAIRLKLGFDDQGKEEVDDKIIEDFEYNDMLYRTQQEELKERKTIKLVTDIKGISKQDLQANMLKEEEKFRSV